MQTRNEELDGECMGNRGKNRTIFGLTGDAFILRRNTSPFPAWLTAFVLFPLRPFMLRSCGIVRFNRNGDFLLCRVARCSEMIFAREWHEKRRCAEHKKRPNRLRRFRRFGFVFGFSVHCFCRGKLPIVPNSSCTCPLSERYRLGLCEACGFSDN